jgi:aerobic-type carbon monoxide dehydrogenase small subunit (CoxS/CutS family)
MTISFTINGTAHEVTDDAGDVKLLDYMHEMMTPSLTGTKFCCGMGVCRACTVAMTKSPNPNAEPIVSCSTALATINGADITTIEGVSDGDTLHPIQTAFLKNFAFQCGYCTPGFGIASKIFLDWLATAPVTEDQLDAAIEDAIGDHICRCTGYVRYQEALRETALAMSNGEIAQ